MFPSREKRSTHRCTSRVLSDALRSPCSFPIGDKTRAQFPRTRTDTQAMTRMTPCWTYRVRAQRGPGWSSGIPPPSTKKKNVRSLLPIVAVEGTGRKERIELIRWRLQGLPGYPPARAHEIRSIERRGCVSLSVPAITAASGRFVQHERLFITYNKPSGPPAAIHASRTYCMRSVWNRIRRFCYIPHTWKYGTVG